MILLSLFFMQKLKLLPIALWSTLLFFSTVSYGAAAQKLYQIDVIVFQHITPQGLSSQLWPKEPHKILSDNAIFLTPLAEEDLDTPSTDPVTYQVLPQRRFLLKREAYRLKHNPDYQILLHTAWLQPLNPLKTSKTIHLYGGTPFNSLGQPVAPAEGQALTYASDGIMAWQLDGTLTIAQTHYLTARADFLLNQPTDSLKDKVKLASANEALATFRLTESARMRADELHYLDNPLLGVLIKVHPVSIKKNKSSKSTEEPRVTPALQSPR